MPPDQMLYAPRFANGSMLPDIHRSARKHFRRDHLSDDAIVHAATHVLNSRPLDDEDDPRRWLMIGVDQAGRLIELVVLVYDDNCELIIHAMKARPQFLNEL